METKHTGASDPNTSSARDLRRQDKIRQIVRAATGVFLEHGFSATSMDKIVEKAGVSKRTLYNYYQSKEEIFIAVMEMQLGSIYKKFEPGENKSGDLAEQLGRVGIEWLRIINSPVTLSLFRNTVAESQRFPKLAHQFFEEGFGKVIEGIAAILEREMDNSGIIVSDTKQAGEYFLDLLTGTAYDRVVFGIMPPMNDKAIRLRTERALSYFFRTH